METWRKYVIQQARSILASETSSKSGLYRKLQGIIDSKFNRGVRGRFTGGRQMPSLTFVMPQYGEYLDKGVSGTNPDIDGYVSNGEYSFKKKKKSIKVKGNTALAAWAKKRGLNQWAVARNVHQRGIKRTLFFTKPFTKRYKLYLNKYHDAVANDILNNIANQLEKLTKVNNIK